MGLSQHAARALRLALGLSHGSHQADAIAMSAELWTDQLQECDSDDDAESIEVAEQKCAPVMWASTHTFCSRDGTSARPLLHS